MEKFGEIDSADMCAGKFSLVSMGGRAGGLACADPGVRTPIGASGNLPARVSAELISPNFPVFRSKYGYLGGWGVTLLFFSLVFVLLGSPYKFSNPYDKSFWD